MTALVHDYLLVNRGAERSFVAICDLYDGSPITTLLFDPEVFGWLLERHSVSVSKLQRLGLKQDDFRTLLPVMPAAVERLPVQGHELVISSSSAFAHGVNPSPGAVHVCYCYTPFRYAWYEGLRALAQVPAPLRPILRLLLRQVRAWDYARAQRPTHYVAISEISRERIQKYWSRDAAIVYPPVDVRRFRPGQPDDFFLFVGELVRHKQVDVALAAAERARVPIRIVGGGSDEDRLRERYGAREGVEFLGRISDSELDALYPRARALVMPNVEEFGITAVEAQAAGRPVIAADGGGARETVISGRTGMLVPHCDIEALAAAMVDPFIAHAEVEHMTTNAARFSVDAFQRGIAEQVELATRAAGQRAPGCTGPR